ncbi:MEGF8 protein, partial [Bucco capensis]|nr:MEGF8 protein [Bucco capensis]
CPRCAPQGPRCERCLPLFVGSARAGGKCISCREFCSHRADICLSAQELQRARTQPHRYPL